MGLMGANASMPWAPAYPLINGGYRPSFPVPGVPASYGSPGCGFGQDLRGCQHYNSGYGSFASPIMGGHPMMMGGLGMMMPPKKYNPMGYFAPHPSSYQMATADAVNKYLGVPLLKPPAGLPWHVPQAPNAKASNATDTE